MNIVSRYKTAHPVAAGWTADDHSPEGSYSSVD